MHETQACLFILYLINQHLLLVVFNITQKNLIYYVRTQFFLFCEQLYLIQMLFCERFTRCRRAA